MLGVFARKKIGCRLILLRWPVTRPARLSYPLFKEHLSALGLNAQVGREKKTRPSIYRRVSGDLLGYWVWEVVDQ